MEKPFGKFLKNLLIFSFILGLIVFGAGFIIPSKFMTPVLPFLFAFYIALTILEYFLMYRSLTKTLIKFFNSFLIITSLKLLLLIGIFVLYIMLNRKDAGPFAVAFFSLFIIYFAFGMTSLVSYSRSVRQQG